ncbi:hypothetical protein F2Q68_00010873 [Brassica cretica]|uniref:GDSL esterase/lipase n=1 Tax=Brassica cretica TaxID=69181 RepID=A0A8S9KXZ7_BRACR|nr:hypothetical protein F2Q68_00010873 [Brassica cretica]
MALQSPSLVVALDVHLLRQLAAKHNVTTIVVFGDSSVDPGNNNFLNTDLKGNFSPYGGNFVNHKSTGRLCDGLLAPDFIAEAMGYPPIPAFLDPTLTQADLPRGASFASAGSGYDDLTANISSPSLVVALDVHLLRQLAAKHNVTTIVVFGDSSVDPGNNNFLNTDLKGNFPPYGGNFVNHKSTGRLCDGLLAPDFIAEAMGYPPIPAFLDPTLTQADLPRGASFASAGSGYDDLTANISNVWSFSTQATYFLHYKIHLNKLVGPLESAKMINNAIFLMSMGSNDFLQNYLVDFTRQKQFTVEQYIDFLSSRMLDDAKVSLKLRKDVVELVPMNMERHAKI